jgi:hypothetical protein
VYIEQAEIELSFRIVENAQLCDLASHPLEIDGPVLAGDSDKREDTSTNGCDLRSCYRDLGVVHPLDDSSHEDFRYTIFPPGTGRERRRAG